MVQEGAYADSTRATRKSIFDRDIQPVWKNRQKCVLPSTAFIPFNRLQAAPDVNS
jgi:hypothetical protein